MGDEVSVEKLIGSWVVGNSENDSGPVTWQRQGPLVPPSRSWRILEIGADGQVREGVPGPDDRGQWQVGTWTLDGDRLTITLPDRPPEVLDIEGVTPDRIAARRI
jgi:hypothetical protein